MAPYAINLDRIMRLFDTSPIHQADHAPSYYAYSQHDTASYPQLNDDIRVDVCIVGGGFSGVATAVELSEMGYKVALLESQKIGWGATGRNGGQIIGGFGEALSGSQAGLDKKFGSGASEHLKKMGWECVDIIRQRVEKYGLNCDLKWGYLDVAINSKHVKNLQAWGEELTNDGHGHKVRWLDETEINNVVKSPLYCGGLINEGYGHVQPLNLCKEESRVAQSLGAQIFENSRVTHIDYGDPATVHTEKGKVTANFVVLAGNAYLKQLSPKLAPELGKYVLPASSYIIATEPLSIEQREAIMTEDYAVCDQRTALDYYRFSADGRLLFGGMANYSARDPKSIRAAMEPKMHKVFPQLKNVSIDFEWGGHMGIGLNRVPQFGRLENNVYYVQAYSGHGVAPTHMSGRILAETINGQATRFDVMDKVKHIPFPGGELLRQPLLAAGMMFYKIRDELGLA